LWLPPQACHTLTSVPDERYSTFPPSRRLVDRGGGELGWVLVSGDIANESEIDHVTFNVNPPYLAVY